MRFAILPLACGALIWSAGVGLAQQPPDASQEAPAAAPAAPAGKPGGGRGGPFAACRADISSLCSDAPSGLAGRLQCLKANQNNLSPDCIAAVKDVLGIVIGKAKSDSAPRPLKACQQDLANLCPDVAAGSNGRMKCLREHSAKLSPACSDALKETRAQAQNALKACDADRTRLCAGQGAGAQIRCLTERTAELSPECRQVISTARPAKAKAAGAPNAPQDKQPAAPAAQKPSPPAPTGAAPDTRPADPKS